MSKNVCIVSRAWLLLLDVDVLCKIKFTGRSEVEPVAISSLTEVTVNTLHLPRLETVDAGLAGHAGLRLNLLEAEWSTLIGPDPSGYCTLIG